MGIRELLAYIITRIKNLFKDRRALFFIIISLLTLAAIFYPQIKSKIRKLKKDQ